MAIYGLDRLLKSYGEEYLVIEYNHLFVSDTIREEIWLLQRKNDSHLIENILQAAAAFSIHDVDADRPLNTFSGGQQAILACLLVMAAIRVAKLNGVKLLLNNILNSISEDNRRTLYQRFHEIRKTHGVGFYTTANGRVEEITC